MMHFRYRESPAAGRSSTKGFTLLEMVVVLVVLGLALALIAPDMRSGLDNIRYRTAVRRLAATLRYARSEAVHGKETREVIINTVEGSYKLSPPSGGNNGNSDGGEGDPSEGEGSPSGKLKTVKFPAGLVVEEGDGSYLYNEEDPLVVSFYAKGSSSGADLLLKGGGIGYRLVVNAVTGRVKISSVER